MAASGFEGFEKRLELHFMRDDACPLGLRQIDFPRLKQVLDAVQCSVVSAMGNMHFDAYVLSESSLFVYPDMIIIKTCGTTQLLKSVSGLLSSAFELGLTITKCRYTRGSFIFPDAQPFPHTSFKDEVTCLENSLPSSLCYRKSCIMQPPKDDSLLHAWHAFTATANEHYCVYSSTKTFTMEVCMTQLDRDHANRFFRRSGDKSSGDMAGREMTVSTGIMDINSEAIICDYAFDPCGYSMNGMDGSHYSTIHVTPEDGFSYASFECVGATHGGWKELEKVMVQVLRVFRPGAMSVALTAGGEDAEEISARVATALKAFSMEGGSYGVQDFPGAETIAFQTFRDSQH